MRLTPESLQTKKKWLLRIMGNVTVAQGLIPEYLHYTPKLPGHNHNTAPLTIIPSNVQAVPPVFFFLLIISGKPRHEKALESKVFHSAKVAGILANFRQEYWPN